MPEWSSAAEADAEGILLFIAEESPENAWSVYEEIFSRVDTLDNHPKLGRTGRVKGTGEFVLSGLPYIVVYRALGRRVQIIRILHGSQKWPA